MLGMYICLSNAIASPAPPPTDPARPRCRPVVLRPHRLDFVSFGHRGAMLGSFPHMRQVPAVPQIG